MNDERREQLAALSAMNFLDDAEKRELRADPKAADLEREFAETWAELAHDAPAVPPPPTLKRHIMAQLPAQRLPANVIPFAQWVPYAIAACMMLLGIVQAVEIEKLKAGARDMQTSMSSQLADLSTHTEDTLLQKLQLDDVPPAPAAQTDPTYASTHVLVAWDPANHCGEITTDGLPPAPAGRDYELWALDPKAAAPIRIGLVKSTEEFDSPPLSTPQPGFAISLEPKGGVPEPTGPILFAVAPGR